MDERYMRINVTTENANTPFTTFAPANVAIHALAEFLAGWEIPPYGQLRIEIRS